MNNSSSSPFFKKSTSRQKVSHANFIEALKSSSSGIAKDSIKGFSQDFVLGTAKQVGDTLLNTNQSKTPNQENPDPFNFAEYLHSSEKSIRSQDRVKYEYERQETVIFNRRQEEVNHKIDQIRVELKRLAKEIVYLDQSTQAVIAQEIKNPGTYHLNFFEKLLSFLQYMRKRVVESRHWASLQNQRSATKSYYWQMSNKKVGGTKFMLSQERTLATQTG